MSTAPAPTPATTPSIALHVRSYGPETLGDRHAFAQLVLPLAGSVELSIAGREGRADVVRAAVVPPEAWHDTRAHVDNRSLIVDIDAAAIAGGPWARLLERPYVALDEAARKLVDYMVVVGRRRNPDGTVGAPPPLLQGWAPLLLDALAASEPQPRSRLAALLARVEAEPGLAWTTEAMARLAHVSTSRLHALFREELDTTPHVWLLGRRVALACARLTGTDRPIAEIALAAGFSDQTALTRALRQQLGTTPAAYRRERRRDGVTASR